MASVNGASVARAAVGPGPSPLSSPTILHCRGRDAVSSSRESLDQAVPPALLRTENMAHTSSSNSRSSISTEGQWLQTTDFSSPGPNHLLRPPSEAVDAQGEQRAVVGRHSLADVPLLDSNTCLDVDHPEEIDVDAPCGPSSRKRRGLEMFLFALVYVRLVCVCVCVY